MTNTESDNVNDIIKFQVKNARYTEFGDIDCEICFNEETDNSGRLIYYYYTSTKNDPANKDLFNDLVAGKYGTVKPFVVTNEVLDHAKKNAWQRIQKWRDLQEQGTVIFTENDHKWDCSKSSMDRLEPVIFLAKNGTLPDGFFWTDAVNNNVPVNAEQLIAIHNGMVQAIVNQGFKIHERQRFMKNEINGMTDLSLINNYIPDWGGDNE